MYETLSRALFTNGDVKKAQRRRDANLTSRISTYYEEKAPPHPDGQTIQTPECFLRCKCQKKKFKFLVLGSVSRCGRRQVVFSSEYVDGKGGAERRQVGWSVTASHWCVPSYVGINHDSEMTYFLTPQTNCTFNRSQGLCQTAFSPCSLSKVASRRIGLPRHNAGDVRFYRRHHPPLHCNWHQGFTSSGYQFSVIHVWKLNLSCCIKYINKTFYKLYFLHKYILSHISYLDLLADGQGVTSCCMIKYYHYQKL